MQVNSIEKMSYGLLSEVPDVRCLVENHFIIIIIIISLFILGTGKIAKIVKLNENNYINKK